MIKKPRIRFCWECGRKLWGNHFEEREYHGNTVILHKECAKKFDKEKE